jgi:hypothetical protein
LIRRTVRNRYEHDDSTQPANQPNDPAKPGRAHAASFQAPKESLFQRINWRMVVFGIVVLSLIGAPFYIWLRSAISGGIIHHGDYSEVDLKAMSTFDMDQVNAQLTDIPPQWRALEGTRVQTIGEMWAQQEAGDGQLTYFQLVYSKTKCCFSGPPLAQHFVDCHVKPGVESYYADRARIEGTLHVRLRKEVDDKAGITIIKSVYEIDVDKVEPIS